MTSTLQREPGVESASSRRGSAVAIFGVAIVATVAVCAVHVTQGTSAIGAGDLLGLLAGDGDERTRNILIGSRLPRLLAGVVVGAALGASGAVLQTIARNALASPDTLGVNAGAYFAVTVVTSFGVALPAFVGGLVAFGGGLATALMVLMLAAGASSTTRIVLAGSATALALASATGALLLLYEEETKGLFAWGSGSLTQLDMTGVSQIGPVVGVSVVGAVFLGRRLDLMALGDDTASGLGVNVTRTRVYGITLAVLLAACAVALAGPIGFVGLCAPAIVRLASRRTPVLQRHVAYIFACTIAGVLAVLIPDVVVRAVLGGQGGIEIPTGVVTTLIGAAVLITLARGRRDSGSTRRPPGARGVAPRSRSRFLVVACSIAVLLVAALVAGILLGYTTILLGDVGHWLTGEAGMTVSYVMAERTPRVLAALLAGAALALAGVVVQAVCRNPLADPSLLGITGGAGVGALTILLVFPAVGAWGMSATAAAGAMVAFALVYGLARAGGFGSDRLVLIGVGVQAGATALTTFIILRSDPFNTALALTWLSGSTYGRSLDQLVPVALALAVFVPVAAVARRELDLCLLDDDTPRVLGMSTPRFRLVALTGCGLLAAAAVTAIGVVGFVGLVAPHAARALVGSRHLRVIPVAILLGSTLVVAADAIGRTVIAPAQIPAGLLTAMIGAPYFVWLLWRSRA